MSLLRTLVNNLRDPDQPFLFTGDQVLSPRHILDHPPPDLGRLRKGDAVALVGGFDAASVSAFLHLLDAGMIAAPLTPESGRLEPFLEGGRIDAVMRHGQVERVRETWSDHPIMADLRQRGQAGLMFFSSGTTGAPKAILHEAGRFLARYHTPRKPLRTLAFLLFDHIGGINTLLHMLFNNGQVIVPAARSPEGIVREIQRHGIELLPSSPTFLRMLLFSGLLHEAAMPSLKLVTYGTERMDQPTLDALCAALPQVDFRQTYGLSELGILRVKSRARDSLWMQIGGEGVETKVEDDILHIRAENRMLGYLNAPQPFDEQGWFRTGDIVLADGPWLRVMGRINDVINVGGLKVRPEEVEKEALTLPGVLFAKARAGSNPITGQHVELALQTAEPLPDKEAEQIFTTQARRALAERLPAHAAPRRITLEVLPMSHRFKMR